MVAIMKPMRNIHYNLFLLPEPEGGFTVIVPALPGCVTYGRNLVEAKEMAADAIKGHVASLRKHRESIPLDDGFVTSIDLMPSKAAAHA